MCTRCETYYRWLELDGYRFNCKVFVSPQVYETLTGVKVEGKLPILKKESVLQSLPSEWPLDPTEDIQRLTRGISKTLVVLDDDPTGTQTVHDVEVLTEWWSLDPYVI